eukprot:7391544-Prymnesium_polylepis.4
MRRWRRSAASRNRRGRVALGRFRSGRRSLRGSGRLQGARTKRPPAALCLDLWSGYPLGRHSTRVHTHNNMLGHN